MIDAASTYPERSCANKFLASSSVRGQQGLDVNLSTDIQFFHTWKLAAELGISLHQFCNRSGH